MCVNAFDLSNMKRMRDKVSPIMRGSSTGTLCKPNRGSSVCMDAGLQLANAELKQVKVVLKLDNKQHGVTHLKM